MSVIRYDTRHKDRDGYRLEGTDKAIIEWHLKDIHPPYAQVYQWYTSEHLALRLL